MARSIASRDTTTSILTEVIGLQTPRGRLLFFGGISGIIYLLPFKWLAKLSLYQYVGISAPSQGLTRAYWRLLHGDFVGAWQQNKLIFLVLIIGLPLLAIDVGKHWRHQRSGVIGSD